MADEEQVAKRVQERMLRRKMDFKNSSGGPIHVLHDQDMPQFKGYHYSHGNGYILCRPNCQLCPTKK